MAADLAMQGAKASSEMGYTLFSQNDLASAQEWLNTNYE